MRRIKAGKRYPSTGRRYQVQTRKRFRKALSRRR